jgi:RNA polymerase sigma-70 factor (ECF subfamily)
MMTEAEIHAGCRRGDRQAQQDLYTRTVQRIHRLLVRMTRNADDAAELTQQTYLRAFTRIDQFDGRSALATWLYRIAVTEGLQWLRRNRRDDAPVVTPLVEQAAAGDPAFQARLGDLKLDMNEALYRLDPIDRTMLLLRYDAGEDYRAIAQIVDCAEGTVASRLHRARERLRGLLEASYQPGEENATSVHPTR